MVLKVIERAAPAFRKSVAIYSQLRDKYAFGNIIFGSGRAMNRIFELIETVASLTSTMYSFRAKPEPEKSSSPRRFTSTARAKTRSS